MPRRLRGWTRVGIVLSVVWVLGVFLWATDELVAASQLIYGLYSKCVLVPNHDLSSCDAMATDLRAGARLNIFGRTLWLTVVLIPAAWVLIYGLVALCRWVSAGLQHSTLIGKHPFHHHDKQH
jgi:hypothetical protein